MLWKCYYYYYFCRSWEIANFGARGVARGRGTWVHVPRRIWKLAFVSGFWGFAPRPHRGSAPRPHWGTSVPQTPSFVSP